MLTGIGPASVGLLSLAYAVSSSLFGILPSRRELNNISGIQCFAVAASLLGLVAGIGLSEALWPLVNFLVLIAAFLLVRRWYRQRQRVNFDESSDSETVVNKPDSGSNLALTLTSALFLMGWQSLGFFAAGLIVARILRTTLRGNVCLILRIVSVSIGFSASYLTEHRFVGQYWVSVDQLWRATMAAGLSEWGYSDFGGAVGMTLRYHWLAEATAGVISNLSMSTAIDGVTKVLPVVGVLLSLVGLKRFGIQLGFDKNVSLMGGLTVVVLCKEFELFSIGSLWGIGLYLVGLSALLRLVMDARAGDSSHWHNAGLAALITPLITLCQSTLGLHFALLSGILTLYSLVRKHSSFKPIATSLVLQTALIVVLRRTLLASETSDMFSPSISISNFLQFRGVEIYDGDNRLLITLTSVLFLFLLSQKGIGLMLLAHSRAKQRFVRLTLLFTSLASLIPANLISMGGFESQQSRFLSPLQVLVTFISTALILESLRHQLDSTSFGRYKIRGTVMLAITVSVFVVYQRIYGATWSPQRSVGVGVIILFGQVLAFTIWWAFARGAFREQTRKLPIVAFIACVSFLANGRNLSNLLEYQATARDLSRAREFIGSPGTQDCLREVREATEKKVIIASNWFRTPPPARRPKNFLVSAHTERRVFLDGPEYIGYFVDGPSSVSTPSMDWLDDRYQATDNFAERASGNAYEVLRAADVEYFVFETYMPAPPTWEPYAEVIFERDSCKILKLRT